MCDKCENKGYIEGICGHCNGSGEGLFDGLRCSACKGTGVGYEICDCEKGEELIDG